MVDTIRDQVPTSYGAV